MKIKSIISFVLAFLLLFISSSNTVISALGFDETPETIVNPDSTSYMKPREISSRREENVKHYFLGDGLSQAISFGKAIHRKNALGEWAIIDNELKEISSNDQATIYGTKDGWLTITPSINSFKFTVTSGDYSITQTIKGKNDTVPKVKIENGETICNEDSFESIEEAIEYYNSFSSTSSFLCENLFENIDFEYTVSDNDIKEYIVIKSPSDISSFTVSIDVQGLFLTENPDKTFSFYSTETNQEIYRISSPFMVDGKGDYSTDIEVSLHEEDGSFLFTIVPGSEWLASSTREYPVRIDPSINETILYDTYIDSSNTTATHGGDSSLTISSSCIPYIKASLNSIPSGSTIEFASLSLYYFFDDNISTSNSVKIGVYQVLQNWSEYSWNWAAASQYTNLGLSNTCISLHSANESSGATSSSPEKITFVITSAVNSWFTGSTNYGLALRRDTSSTANKVYIKSYESGQNYRGYISISYLEPIITEGVYYIKSTSSNLYLECRNGGYTSGTIIQQNNKNEGNRKQLFKITYIGDYSNDRYYDIRPMTNSGLGLFAPYATASDHFVLANSMSSSDGWYDIPQRQRWTIMSHGTSYVTLMNAFSENGGYLATQNSTAGSQIITKSTQDASCRWKLEQYTAGSFDGITAISVPMSVAVGTTDTYTVYMYSSTIGRNGPVSYSVTKNDYTTTNNATINSSTGLLTAVHNGSVRVIVTYPNAPWLWSWLIKITPYYGCKSYYQINSGTLNSYTINCQGYAFCTYNIPSGWYTTEQWTSLFSVATTSNEVLYGKSGTDGIKTLLELYLNSQFTGRWTEVFSSTGGSDLQLSATQWLIAFRVGKYSGYMDYHFWYRTDSGEWANKHGFQNGSPSEPLGSDIPTTPNSNGWKLGDINNFYNSDIIYYIISE